MKNKLFHLACCLVCIIMAKGCSVDDADSPLIEAMPDKAGATFLYSGTWTFASTSSSLADFGYHFEGAPNTLAQFHPDNQTLTISQPPVSLFLGIAGITGATTIDAPSYTVQCFEKGYNENSVVYGATTPAYTFSYSIGDGKTHLLRVVFKNNAEVGFNNYLNTLIIYPSVAEIDLDGTKTNAYGGGLIYEAERK